MMMDAMGLGMGFWGLIIMVMFWVALVALAVWLVGLLFPVAHQHAQRDNPNSKEK